MTGNAVKIGSNLYPITYPKLWQACSTEEEYFRILRDRQTKGGDHDPLIIEETEEQRQVPGSLF